MRDRARQIIDGIGDSNVIIISHWDTDGLCSAVKLWGYFGRETDLYTPPIGRYDIPGDEMDIFGGYDYIIVTDIALPGRTISRLSESAAKHVLVIDHHYHPDRGDAIYVDYKMPNGLNFYSNTLLIDDLLGLEGDIITALGLVGDYKHEIRNTELYGWVRDIAYREGLSIEDLYRLTLLIDSNHIVNDREAVYRAAHTIYEYRNSIPKLLDNDEWISKYNSIEEAIERVVGEASPDDSIVYHRFSSRYYIISKVGRRLSSIYRGKVVILVNDGFDDSYDQVYVRISGGGDVFPLIGEGKRRGYVCGGKWNVAGFIVPKRESMGFIEYIMGWVKANLVG